MASPLPLPPSGASLPHRPAFRLQTSEGGAGAPHRRPTLALQTSSHPQPTPCTLLPCPFSGASLPHRPAFCLQTSKGGASAQRPLLPTLALQLRTLVQPLHPPASHPLQALRFLIDLPSASRQARVVLVPSPADPRLPPTLGELLLVAVGNVSAASKQQVGGWWAVGEGGCAVRRQYHTTACAAPIRVANGQAAGSLLLVLCSSRLSPTLTLPLFAKPPVLLPPPFCPPAGSQVLTASLPQPQPVTRTQP